MYQKIEINKHMGNTTYITAIEISSSKISGTVGIETYNGIKILAAASTPVKGFISKGVVRNVDETSNAINYIINTLESGLDRVSIKRAYVSLAGLTVKSIKSTVTRTFDTFTKITPDIINDMADENDRNFLSPDGYTKFGVICQDYKLNGKSDTAPVGEPTMQIEGNYLNLVIQEQYLNQLNESFAQAKIDIADSFCAACMDADILLSKDVRRNGCALVNIGAETTTVSIYRNDILRKLIVLPLGSNNITTDLCAGQISFDEAEEIKIARGYKSAGHDNSPIDTDTVNNIINARMSEILQNVKYQVEESGELINHIIFTGGGSKLKNIELLLEEYMPNFRYSIISEPKFNLVSESGVNINGIFSTALYGLVSQGKENCCEEEKPVMMAQPVEQKIMFDIEPEEQVEETEVEETEPEISPEEARRLEKEARRLAKEAEKREKEERKLAQKRLKEQQKKNSPGLFDWLKQGTKSLIGEITSDDSDLDNYDDDDNN